MTSTDQMITIMTLDGGIIKNVPMNVINRIGLLKTALEMNDIGNDNDSDNSEQIEIPTMHPGCTEKIMNDIIKYTKMEIENEKFDLIFRKEHQIKVEDSESKDFKELPHNYMMDWSKNFMKSLVDGDPMVIDDTNNCEKFSYLFEVFSMVFFMNQTNMLEEQAKYIASLITGNDTIQLRKKFGIDDDFTPEMKMEANKKLGFLLSLKSE
jgi:hypothetical protein